MTKIIRDEIRDDLLGRGYSRRQMMRAAMMFGGTAAALTLNPEIAFAQGPPQPRPGRAPSDQSSIHWRRSGSAFSAVPGRRRFRD